MQSSTVARELRAAIEAARDAARAVVEARRAGTSPEYIEVLTRASLAAEARVGTLTS